MTIEELAAYWGQVAARVPDASAAAANAMMTAEHRYLVTNVLVRYSHPPCTKTPSPPGQPPAIVTGTLRRSLRDVPAPPAARTTASLAPHTVYARIQEVGGTIRPVRRKFLRWCMDGHWVFAKHSTLPARPYMLPARNDLVANGTFHRVAEAAFFATVGVG